MTTTNQAIIYLRVSTTVQSESGLGLADQEERCRAYCTLKGLEIAGVVSDIGVSGAKPLNKRKRGVKLVKGLKKGTHIVALKLDRLFRSTTDCLVRTAQWADQGHPLHLVDFGGNAIDTTSAMGRMFLTMAAGFAELERGLISERTKAALDVKRARGEYVGGTVPYGKSLVGGQLCDNVEELRILDRMQVLLRQKHTLKEIAGHLNRTHTPRRDGQQWTKHRVWRAAQRLKASA